MLFIHNFKKNLEFITIYFQLFYRGISNGSLIPSQILLLIYCWFTQWPNIRAADHDVPNKAKRSSYMLMSLALYCGALNEAVRQVTQCVSTAGPKGSHEFIYLRHLERRDWECKYTQELACNTQRRQFSRAYCCKNEFFCRKLKEQRLSEYLSIIFTMI